MFVVFLIVYASLQVSDTDGKEVHVPVETVNVVDTTGAGDSFLGALAFFMARHPHMVCAVFPSFPLDTTYVFPHRQWTNR